MGLVNESAKIENESFDRVVSMTWAQVCDVEVSNMPLCAVSTVGVNTAAVVPNVLHVSGQTVTV